MENAGHECVGFCEFDKYARTSYISMHLINEEQRDYLSALKKTQRQKEILKDEYLNGEWSAWDIRDVNAVDLPKADCWCFGAPCVSFSLAGSREGLDGESGLIKEIFRLLWETKEEDRPEWLIYENVKGMFSSNKGFDYLAILTELDALRYDAEWQLFNSKFYVPQNRERVYTIGHLRRYGSRKVFSEEGTDGEAGLEIKQVAGIKGSNRENPNQYRVYDPNGLCPTLSKMEGGGRQPHIIVMGTTNPERHSTHDVHDKNGIMSTMLGRDYKEPKKVGIAIGIDDLYKNRPTRFYEESAPTLRSERSGLKVAVNVDEKSNKKDGIYVDYNGANVYAVWNEKYQCYVTIRKLLPIECFRLQGFPDSYFRKAEFVNSDSQLYKQIGNSVTVPIVEEIAKRLTVSKKKLKVLELFAGTRSVSKAFEARGHETFSVELDTSFDNINLYKDISQLTAQEILKKFGHPDVIWASPPCQSYSVAAIYRHRRKDSNGSLAPISEFAKMSDKLNQHVLELIKELNPTYWFIENPRAGLRKMDFMQDLPRYTVTYCQYGDTRMKATDLWTNHPNPKFKPPCKNGDPCHVRAPRGSVTGTQGIKGAKLRAVIPKQLCEHIVDICEES